MEQICYRRWLKRHATAQSREQGAIANGEMLLDRIRGPRGVAPCSVAETTRMFFHPLSIDVNIVKYQT